MPWAHRISPIREWSRAVFTLDLRSLAIYRIGLGLMVMADHIMRSIDMKWFYTDYGVFPTSAVWHLVKSFRKPSVHALSGEMEFQIALFILAGLASIALMLGWRTRIASILCWYLTISIQHRFVHINSGADVLLSGQLFWAMFLPLGARFSLDARRRPEKSPHDNGAYSGATVALIFQILLLYIFNALNKYGLAWRDGSAVLRALHIDQYATPPGAWVRDVIPWITYPMTRFTLVVEWAVLLLLIPWRQKWIRLGLVGAFWAIHAGFNAFMYLALFSPISMTIWLSVIPSEAWNVRGFKRLGARMVRGLGPRHRLPKLLSAALIVTFFVFPAWANFDKTWGWKRPKAVRQTSYFLRLNQNWRMFAPTPMKNDFWWVVETQTKGAGRIDLMRNGDKLTWKKPRYASQLYITGKHRRLWMSLKCKKKPLRCKRILDRMCRDHNEGLAADDPNRAVRTTLWKMKERTPKNLRKKPKVKKVKEFRRRCPSSRALKKAEREAKKKAGKAGKRKKKGKSKRKGKLDKRGKFSKELLLDSKAVLDMKPLLDSKAVLDKKPLLEKKAVIAPASPPSDPLLDRKPQSPPAEQPTR